MQEPPVGKRARIAIYNGTLLGASAQAAERTRIWDLARPLAFKVRYNQPKSYKANRTVLRFELPEQTVSVAVEDVVAKGCVYVPSAGLFVTVDPPQLTLPQYLQQIAGRKTVLERVRERPDQSFAEAMAKTHNPIQDLGPMVVSLACDNRKFVAERDGTIRFFHLAQ